MSHGPMRRMPQVSPTGFRLWREDANGAVVSFRRHCERRHRDPGHHRQHRRRCRHRRDPGHRRRPRRRRHRRLRTRGPTTSRPPRSFLRGPTATAAACPARPPPPLRSAGAPRTMRRGQRPKVTEVTARSRWSAELTIRSTGQLRRGRGIRIRTMRHGRPRGLIRCDLHLSRAVRTPPTGRSLSRTMRHQTLREGLLPQPLPSINCRGTPIR